MAEAWVLPVRLPVQRATRSRFGSHIALQSHGLGPVSLQCMAAITEQHQDGSIWSTKVAGRQPFTHKNLVHVTAVAKQSR